MPLLALRFTDAARSATGVSATLALCATVAFTFHRSPLRPAADGVSADLAFIMPPIALRFTDWLASRPTGSFATGRLCRPSYVTFSPSAARGRRPVASPRTVGYYAAQLLTFSPTAPSAADRCLPQTLAFMRLIRLYVFTDPLRWPTGSRRRVIMPPLAFTFSRRLFSPADRYRFTRPLRCYVYVFTVGPLCPPPTVFRARLAYYVA